MTDPNLTKLARKGNLDAIATLLNFELQPFEATAIASTDGDVLQVVLHSIKSPDGRELIPVVEKVVRSLAIPHLRLLRITGYQTGIALPEWNAEVRLRLWFPE